MSRFGLYGPRKLVLERFEIVKEAVKQRAPSPRPNGHLFEDEKGYVEAETIHTALGGGQVGVPDMWTLPSVQYRCPKAEDGVGAHTDFSPVLPLRGKDVLERFLAAQPIVEAGGFDIYCGGHLHPRYMILINMYVFRNPVNAAINIPGVQTLWRIFTISTGKQGIWPRQYRGSRDESSKL
ncbi:hypothetical protein BJX68DRAFT_272892 [Aspergillus pseudodeflectus]|uniref:TauD/TfdA-like domain-containing protein n=1 Tax=Aspergillus pseudodeflectus TaxID=176178 RepID=A0ABR4JFQ4_9EURO